MAKADKDGKAKPKPVKKALQAWVSMSDKDYREMEDGFAHLTVKTVNSQIKGGYGVRLPEGKGSGIPYVGLSTIGAGTEDMDMNRNAADLPRPRQIMDQMHPRTGVSYDLSKMDENDHQEMDQERQGSFRHNIASFAETGDKQWVDPFCKQIFMREPIEDGGEEEVLLTPISGLGLSRRIRQWLEAERIARTQAAGVARRFWKTMRSALGGAKPQNLGLIGALDPASAKFCLWTPAPGFADQRIAEIGGLIKNGLPLRMEREERERLNQGLAEWIRAPGKSQRNQAEEEMRRALGQWVRRLKRDAAEARRLLLDELSKLRREGKVASESSMRLEDLANALLSGSIDLGMERLRVGELSDEDLGWLKLKFKEPGFAREASASLYLRASKALLDGHMLPGEAMGWIRDLIEKESGQ